MPPRSMEKGILAREIENLEQMTATLGTLVDCCAGDDRPDCPILADLEEPSGEPKVPSPATAGTGRLRHRP